MLISAGEHTIKLDAWQTKRELACSLSSCDVGSILLGDDTDEARQFYSVVVYLKWPTTSGASFGVGICSEGHGLTPHLLVGSNTDLLIFGFNSEVIGISIEEKRPRFRIDLDYLFNSFIHLKKEQTILALHEIGVVALTEDGHERWRYSKDVIGGLTIEKTTLILNFVDSPPVSLDLTSGQVIGTQPRA